MRNHLKIWSCFLAIALAFFLLLYDFNVMAYDATSASFEIHSTDTESIVGSSSSASFINQSAGGQNAHGTSTSATKRDYAGILYWLFGLYTPRYEQIHYRWRNDNGTLTTATWAQTEDTQLDDLDKNAIRRLRFHMSNEGWTRGSGQQFRLEYAETAICSGGSYTAVSTDGSNHWQIAASDNFADGDPVSNYYLTIANASSTIGQAKDTGNQTTALTLASQDYTELEYSVKATNNATAGGAYCFRLTNAGSATNFAYPAYAQVTISDAVPTVSCNAAPASTAFGYLTTSSIYTAGSNVYATTSCTYAAGCVLKINDSGNGSSPGLSKSAPDAYLIPSASATLVAGTNGYGIQTATSTYGSGAQLTLDPDYIYKTGNIVAGLLTSPTELAFAASTFTDREVIVTHKAAVGPLAPASENYIDTITYSCIGN